MSRSGPAPIWCPECKAVVRRENGRRASLRYHQKMQAESAEYRAAKVMKAVAWQAANRERSNAWHREYAKTPAMRAKAAARARAARAAGMPRWEDQHPDRVREIKRISQARNKESRRQNAARRRAVLRGVFVEDVHPLIVLERHDGRCGICGDDVDPFDFHVDHVQPLARGGLHCYANVQPAHPACNIRKGPGR